MELEKTKEILAALEREGVRYMVFGPKTGPTPKPSAAGSSCRRKADAGP